MMPLRVLSLGAGVQSTTLAMMGALGMEHIDHAIFADTQSEPRAVYKHLAWLMEPGRLPFPVHVVTEGSLRQEILDASAGKRGAWGRPPLFLRNPNGSRGMTQRKCTQDYKITPIQRKVRELSGIKPRSRGPAHVVVEQLIGISRDEASRMRDAHFRWIKHVYPLIDRGLTRRDCLALLAKHGWPTPMKSACTFCPYHSNAWWREMKANDPESFSDAVSVDAALRSGQHFMLKGTPYLHPSLRPLGEIDFRTAAEQDGQISLFENECEGMCGV